MNCLDYSDSEEESDAHGKSSSQAGPTAVAVSSSAVKRSLEQDDDAGALKERVMNSVKKKKLLPKLTPTFQTAPIDDPTKHQGRIRARPWVQGEYPAHIYLELRLSKRLRVRLGEIVDRVQSWNDEARPGFQSQEGAIEDRQTVHPLFARVSTGRPDEKVPNTDVPPSGARSTTPSPTLHVSLSHPLPLRSFQIPLLLNHMRRHAGSTGTLKVGLEDGFRAYTNGTQSEGDDQANSAEEDEAVEPEDQSIEGRNSLDKLGRSGLGKKSRGFLALKVGVGHDKLLKIQTETIDRFLQIHHLPRYHRSPEFHASFAWVLLSGSATSPFDEALLTRLEAEYGKGLREEMKGGWEIVEVKVRVGKVVHSFGI